MLTLLMKEDRADDFKTFFDRAKNGLTVESDVNLMLDFQAVIKSAANAAFRKTKIQDSRGAQPSPAIRKRSCRPLASKDSWILVFGRLR